MSTRLGLKYIATCGGQISFNTRTALADEVTRREGLPVTTELSTLADVAASNLASEQVQLAIQETIERGLTSAEALWRYAQKRGRQGYLWFVFAKWLTSIAFLRV